MLITARVLALSTTQSTAAIESLTTPQPPQLIVLTPTSATSLATP